VPTPPRERRPTGKQLRATVFRLPMVSYSYKEDRVVFVPIRVHAQRLVGKDARVSSGVLGKRPDEYRHAALFGYLYNLTNIAGIRETVGEAGYPWKHGSLTARTCGRISRNDYVHQRVLGIHTCKEDRQVFVMIRGHVQR
jgi:hypothetical protein